MTVSQEAEGLIGSHYRAPDYFEVGREKIREFAAALQDDHPTHYGETDAADAGYPAAVAPLTFLAIAGRRVQQEIFTKFKIPINLARVFHRDQKFKFHRPILGGDKLYFDTYRARRNPERSHRRRRKTCRHQRGHDAGRSRTPEHRRNRRRNRVNISRNVGSKSSA
jgi:acyl dehydratase